MAPKGYLTGSEWQLATRCFKDYVEQHAAGKSPLVHLVRGGLKDGIVKLSPYGAAVSDETKKLADAAKDMAMKGELIIFKGPMKDNTGKVVIEDGKSSIQTDPVLEGMGYLVEGVIGSAGGKC